MADVEHTYADKEIYKLPNDRVEQDRLDDQHSAIIAAFGGRINFAPVEQPRRVLDVGCGTGPCTRGFGEQYPSATVYGIDLTPVPATPGEVTPPNVEYIIGNVRSLAGTDARLPLASFDYIFNRLLVYGMPDWPGYLQTVTALAAPGGWVEMHDVALHLHKDEQVRDPEWITTVHEVARAKGMDLDAGSSIAGYMRDAGLVDVQATEYRWPMGTWMSNTRPETRAIGRYLGENIADMQSGFVGAMLEGDARFSAEEVKRLRTQAYETMQAADGMYVKFYVTVGRKPSL